MAMNFLKRFFGMAASGQGASSQAREVPRGPERRERRVEARELPEFAVGVATEASPRHPKVNQDAFAFDAKRHLLMVADGVGSSAKGEIASGAARDAVLELGETLDGMIQDVRERKGSAYLTQEEMSETMTDYFCAIADRVKAAADSKSERNTRSSTTLLVLKVFETAPGKTFAVFKGIGDCQPMVLRANGALERVDIAEDDMMSERVRKGELTEDEAYLISASGSPTELARSYLGYAAELSKVAPGLAEQVTDHDSLLALWGTLPAEIQVRIRELMSKYNRYFVGMRAERSVITALVGSETGDQIRPKVHSAIVPLHPGDRVYLATDGIDALRNAQVRGGLSRGVTVEQQARALVEDAVQANGLPGDRAKPDDITVVGMEVPRGDARIGKRLEAVGFEEEMAYAEHTLEDRVTALADYRAAHPEIAILARIDAGGADPKERAKYVAAQNLLAREEGGIEGVRERMRPVLAKERAMRARVDSMRDELNLAVARQREFEAKRDAAADDPDSPIWKMRVKNAMSRVDQLRRRMETSRAQADAQGAEAARRRANSIAKSLETAG